MHAVVPDGTRSGHRKRGQGAVLDVGTANRQEAVVASGLGCSRLPDKLCAAAAALHRRQRRQKVGVSSTSTLYTSIRPVSMAKLSHHFTASG